MHLFNEVLQMIIKFPIYIFHKTHAEYDGPPLLQQNTYRVQYSLYILPTPAVFRTFSM